jgi:hypothetical protein
MILLAASCSTLLYCTVVYRNRYCICRNRCIDVEEQRVLYIYRRHKSDTFYALEWGRSEALRTVLRRLTCSTLDNFQTVSVMTKHETRNTKHDKLDRNTEVNSMVKARQGKCTCVLHCALHHHVHFARHTTRPGACGFRRYSVRINSVTTPVSGVAPYPGATFVRLG